LFKFAKGNLLQLVIKKQGCVFKMEGGTAMAAIKKRFLKYFYKLSLKG